MSAGLLYGSLIKACAAVKAVLGTGTPLTADCANISADSTIIIADATVLP